MKAEIASSPRLLAMTNGMSTHVQAVCHCERSEANSCLIEIIMVNCRKMWSIDVGIASSLLLLTMTKLLV